MLTVYVKPILKGMGNGDLAKLLLGRLKYSIARAGQKYIKDAAKSAFAGRGNRIRKSVGYTIGKKSVTFHISKIGFFHNFGVAKHKMKYLQKAKRPIPIELKNGEVIFRWASKKSMRRKGSWTHPGIAPKKFLEQGIQNLKKELRSRLMKDAGRYLRGGK